MRRIERLPNKRQVLQKLILFPLLSTTFLPQGPSKTSALLTTLNGNRCSGLTSEVRTPSLFFSAESGDAMGEATAPPHLDNVPGNADGSDPVGMENNVQQEIKQLHPKSNVVGNEEKKEGDEAPPAIGTHYIFLVHGWLGNDKEMFYIGKALNKSIETLFQTLPNKPRIVVHSTVDNKGKTTDGIVEGGKRLAREVQTFIESDYRSQQNQHQNQNASISFVGNSLGGLYARYALSIIPSHLHLFLSQSSEADGKSIPISLKPNVFCTTATPHLGVASHTYLPLPRVAERIIGTTLAQTGRDLFRLDDSSHSDVDGTAGGSMHRDLIYQMNTNYESFLLPLSRFRKRIAYANAFRTDFQVPTNTAAFLSKDSTYPHCLDEDSTKIFESNNTSNSSTKTASNFFFMTVTTPRNNDVFLPKEEMDGNGRTEVAHKQQLSEEDAILTMSNKLDALGWTKVFVDTRDVIPIPGVALPSFLRSPSHTLVQDYFDQLQKGAKSEMICDDAHVSKIKSKELWKIMNRTEKLKFPLGHTVMVANSKSDFYSRLNSGGRPIMDRLASDLIVEITDFS